jgi:hypothetical protein
LLPCGLPTLRTSAEDSSPVARWHHSIIASYSSIACRALWHVQTHASELCASPGPTRLRNYQAPRLPGSQTLQQQPPPPKVHSSLTVRSKSASQSHDSNGTARGHRALRSYADILLTNPIPASQIPEAEPICPFPSKSQERYQNLEHKTPQSNNSRPQQRGLKAL